MEKDSKATIQKAVKKPGAAESLGFPEKLKAAIFKALKKHGVAENLCFPDDLKDDWFKNASEETIKTDITSDLNLRHKLINQGRILEEDLEAHYYCWLIQLKGFGAPEALVVTILDGPVLHIGAYAKEGLLSKGTASKAIQQVKQAILLQ